MTRKFDLPLACRDCGRNVSLPTKIDTLVARGRERRLPGGALVVDEHPYALDVSRCAVCLERRSRAAGILDGHPRVGRGIGSRDYALDVIDAALIALDASGIEPERAEKYAATDRDLRLMIDRLTSIGDGATWAAQFTPVIRLDAVLVSSDERWLHLNPDYAQVIRDRSAAFFMALIETNVAVEPPEDGARGCLLCGVGTVEALKSRAESAWGNRRWQASVLSLGGSLGPEATYGYLCLTDTRVVTEVGGLGPTAVERAFTTYLGEPLLIGWELTNVSAWISLPAGTPPNAEPWAHQPDHDAVRESVQEMREKARKGLVRIE